MASADSLKAEFVDKVQHALEKGISLERALDAEEVQITREGRLLLQVRVVWDRTSPARYYYIKVSEPW